MKLAICGKGCCGKSTATSLLAKAATAGLSGEELAGIYPAVQDLARRLIEGGIR